MGLQRNNFDTVWSLPSLGEWIEISWQHLREISDMSLPSLGEWIEMFEQLNTLIDAGVSPFAGRVD